MNAGDRVIVSPGYYRVGRSHAAHLVVERHSLGTVKVVFEHGERFHAPTEVLVFLDDECLPNAYAPGTVRVSPADVELVVLPDCVTP